MATRRDERGAVAVMVAILLPILMVMSAFAVDLGMQRVARRDMQALADTVALDLGRLIDGRSASNIVAGTNGKLGLATARANSVARNDDFTLGAAPTVTATLINLDAAGNPVLNPDGTIKEISGSAVPGAVLVSATTQVDFAFVSGSGHATRTAIANSASTACFRLGSYALALNSSNSPILNGLVSDALDVQALSYQGLVNASISILGLSTELGAGTADELMTLSNVSLRDLFLASATVLQREGGETADVALLRTLAASVSSKQVNIAQLLSLSSGSSLGLAGNINVLDLVSGGAFAANGQNGLAIPVLWTIPHISSGVTSLTLVERPQLGCGRVNEASASTAQLRLTANLPLHLPTILGLVSADTDVVLNVDLAGAEGLLTAVTCGAGTAASPESIAVRVARALISTLSVAVPVHLTGTIKLPVLGYIGLVNVQLDLMIDAGAATTYPALAAAVAPSTTYAVPPHTYLDPQSVGTLGAPAIPGVSLTSADVTGTASVVLLGGIKVAVPLNLVDLSSVLAAVQTKVVDASVTDLIADVNSLIAPMTDLLGLNIAGADLFGVPRPACDTPTLRG